MRKVLIVLVLSLGVVAQIRNPPEPVPPSAHTEICVEGVVLPEGATAIILYARSQGCSHIEFNEVQGYYLARATKIVID